MSSYVFFKEARRVGGGGGGLIMITHAIYTTLYWQALLSGCKV